MKNSFYILIVLFNFIELQAQERVLVGTIQDEHQLAVVGASLVLKADNKIAAYTFSDKTGHYSITFNQTQDTLVLTVMSLGFAKQTKIIKQSNTEYNFTLKEQVSQINEVVLKSHQKIIRNKDTISFLVSGYTLGTEQTVEDVLKKIPGIEVLKSGEIKAHGKFIEKLLIEGDDMLGSNYKILSKNLNANVLDKVQVLTDFEDNPIIKKVTNSGKVALNLKLKNSLKQVWFGNVLLGAGISSRSPWKGTLTLGLIKKKRKLFYFGNYNNLGEKASESLGEDNVSFSESFSQDKISHRLESAFEIQRIPQTAFLKQYTTFNKAMLQSFSAVVKYSAKTKFRTSLYYANDDDFFVKNSKTIYNTSSLPIQINEANIYANKMPVFSLELETKSYINAANYLNNITLVKIGETSVYESIISNSDVIVQYLNSVRRTLKNDLNITTALGKNSILNNYLYFAYENFDNNALFQSEALNNYFNLANTAKINTDEISKQIYFGLKTKLIHKIKHFEFSNAILGEFKNQSYDNKLFLNLQQDNTRSGLSEYSQFELASENSFRYKPDRNITYSLTLNLKKEHIDKQDFFIFNPKFTIVNRTKIGSFTLNASFNESITNLNKLALYDKITNYRSITKRNSTLSSIPTKNFSTSFSHYNHIEEHHFAIETKLTYSKIISTVYPENILSTTLDFYSYEKAKGGENYSLTFSLTKYFRKIKTIAYLKLNNNWNQSYVAINSTASKLMYSFISSQEFSLATHLNKPYNFDISYMNTYSKSTFNSISNSISKKQIKGSLTYKVSKYLSCSYKSALLIDNSKQNYHFANLKTTYSPENNYSYSFTLFNVFNTKQYIRESIDSFIYYKSEVAIIPRYALFTIKYRF